MGAAASSSMERRHYLPESSPTTTTTTTRSVCGTCRQGMKRKCSACVVAGRQEQVGRSSGGGGRREKRRGIQSLPLPVNGGVVVAERSPVTTTITTHHCHAAVPACLSSPRLSHRPCHKDIRERR